MVLINDYPEALDWILIEPITSGREGGGAASIHMSHWNEL